MVTTRHLDDLAVRTRPSQDHAAKPAGKGDDTPFWGFPVSIDSAWWADLARGPEVDARLLSPDEGGEELDVLGEVTVAEIFLEHALMPLGR